MIDILGRTTEQSAGNRHGFRYNTAGIWSNVVDAGRGSVKRAETTMVSHPAGTLVVSLSIGVVLGWTIKRLM